MEFHCPVTEDNLPLVRWIASITGSCVYGSIGAVSWALGYISICCWICAQLPQVISNYRNRSVDGLSWIFLLNWFLGDITNFIGCILTGQLPFQTLLALYYVCIDAILGGQYLYYSTRTYRLAEHEHHHRHHTHGKRPSHPRSKSKIYEDSKPIFVTPVVPVDIPGPVNASGTSSTTSTFNLKTLLTASFMSSFTRVNAAPLSTTTSAASSLPFVGTTLSLLSINSNLLGVIFAWTCTSLYLTSRLPQIYKNFCRKSTCGTSILLFMAAMTGNITYTASILTSPDALGPHGTKFLLNELPYLIGAAGTVIFDVTIFIQWITYGYGIKRQDSPQFAVSIEQSSKDHDFKTDHGPADTFVYSFSSSEMAQSSQYSNETTPLINVHRGCHTPN